MQVFPFVLRSEESRSPISSDSDLGDGGGGSSSSRRDKKKRKRRRSPSAAADQPPPQHAAAAEKKRERTPESMEEGELSAEELEQKRRELLKELQQGD